VWGFDKDMNRTNVDTFIHQSVLNLAPATKEFEFDTVVHLAALVRVNESVEKPLDYYNTNFNGTVNMLHNCNYKNFIFASTGAAENPISPYALSKRCAEDVVKSYCLENDKRFTTFRFYNVIGSDGIPPTNPDGLFANLIKAKETGYFNLYGVDYDTPDGSAIRDYVHVVEICEAILKAIEMPADQLENLGHGEGHSVKQMVETFKIVNNCNFTVNYNSRREGDLEKSVLDNPSIYLQPKYTLQQLLEVK
jgi:UDP-glucose 4-epimerase